MSKRKVKKVSSYVLAVFLTLSILALTISVSLYDNIFERNALESALDESGYYYNEYNIILNSCNNYLMQSGFDDDLFEGVITRDCVEEDIDAIVRCLFINQKVELDTTKLEERLDKKIKEQVEQKMYFVDEETQKELDEFKKTVAETYKNNIVYSEQVMNEISKYFNKIERALKIIKLSLIALTAIIALLTFKMRKSSVGVGMFTSGVLLLAAKLYSGVYVAINNILIVNWAFSKTLSYILNKVVQNIFTVGIALTLGGLLWIVIFEYIRSKKIYEDM